MVSPHHLYWQQMQAIECEEHGLAVTTLSAEEAKIFLPPDVTDEAPPASLAPSLLPPSAAPTANGAGAASNGRGNGHTAPKVRLRWMAVGGVTPHPGVRNSLQLALFKL